ncbi:MAG: hypothetical protein AB1414_09895 [bacterium]
MRKGETEKGRNGEGEETRGTIPEFAFNLEPNYGHGYRTRFTDFQCFIRVHQWLNSYKNP